MRTEQNGQATVFMAIFMGLIALGFLAFALDAGLLFRQRRMAQAAADAASVAAANELTVGDTANEQAVADAVAKLNGFDTTLSTNPATVTLVTPSSGNFTGSKYVQVTVSKPIKTYLLAAFNHTMATMTVSAQSTAGGGNGSQTVVCLDGTGQVLNISGGSSLSTTGGIVVNSNASNAITVNGSSTLSAQTLGTVSSTWDNSSNIYGSGSISSGTTIVQGITSTCSPALPPVPTYSSCVADPGTSSLPVTVGPSSSSGTICYTSLAVGASGRVETLNPGIYVITGTLHFMSGSGGHSNLGGNGVFFYLPSTANLQIDGGANISLTAGGATESGGGTAPDLGAYDGIILYQATGNATALSLQGGSSTYLEGSLYAPSAAVSVSNGSGATSIGGIYAQSLTVTGGSSLTAKVTTNEGTLVTTYPKLVQ
jgi:Flp pilus assembly protein TadG